MSSYEDTIFAPATAPGRAAIAIVRVSGPDAAAVASLFGFTMPPDREARLRALRDGDRNIDRAMVLWFRGPESYTGEDLVELHLHGGRAVCDGVLAALSRAANFRFAMPGEFSKRAVLNGRLDLTAAEAVNDLVNAETEAQRVQALWQLEGGLAAQFDAWTTKLTRNRAHLEAYIDFPEDDVPLEVMAGIAGDLAEILQSMKAFLHDNRRGERLRDGFRVAVVGPPNAGKSSFVNWLSERDVAIVTELAGTTRDVIEVHLDLGGFPVIVADTAGLRESDDRIETIGMKRALDWARSADLRILLCDATDLDAVSGQDFGLTVQAPDLVVFNKTDLVTSDWRPKAGSLAMSLIVGEGLEDVLQHLTGAVRSMLDMSAGPTMTRVRHRAALEAGIDGLETALVNLGDGSGPEIIAEQLRLAAVALGGVTGAAGVEELLDVVFRDFCIGK